MLQFGALDRVVRGLVEQSARGGRLLAPVLHLHGPGGWQHLTLNVASPEELRGSLTEARKVSELETVDAFVCILPGRDAETLAAGLEVRASRGEGVAYAARLLSGEGRETPGLDEVRDALARLLFGR